MALIIVWGLEVIIDINILGSGIASNSIGLWDFPLLEDEFRAGVIITLNEEVLCEINSAADSSSGRWHSDHCGVIKLEVGDGGGISQTLALEFRKQSAVLSQSDRYD